MSRLLRLFRYDVFISYCSKDQEWVEQLARDLSKEGLRVFYDRWELIAGKPWLRQLEDALKGSAAGIAVLSPDAIASGVVNAELTVLITNAWKEGRPLIPVLHRKCEVPVLLQSVQWVDFRKESDEGRTAAIRQLVRGLRGEPAGPPSVLPRVPTWRLPPLSQRLLVLLMFLVPVVGVLLKEGVGVLAGRSTFKGLNAVQRGVQVLDERVGLLTPTSVARSADEEELAYVDPTTSQRVAADRRVAGILQKRHFYREDRLVARDSFVYDEGVMVEKIREYLDAEQRVFLIDRFAQDGLLLTKRHCPQGPEMPCVVYVDEMRSPLPPIIPMYR